MKERRLNSKVILLKVVSPTENDIYSSLERGISNIIDPNRLSNAKKIVIKVNLCKPFPADSGATVDIRVTESLLKLIWEPNPTAEIYVVESDSGSRFAEEAFRETGYLSLKERHKNLKIVNLSKTSQILVNDHRLRYFKQGLRLSEVFLDCDYFISVSKLKTHEFERFTGILKNQFGCLSLKNKEQYHPSLPKVIADVNSILKPDLCIIDGLVAMEGKGPGFGDPVEMNLLIVGNDPVATDAVAASVIGIAPNSVPHTKETAKRGIGEIELRKISLLGEKIEEVKKEFSFVPARAFYVFRLSLKVRKYAHFLTTVFSFVSSIGRQLERLARALYIRSPREVLIKRVFPELGKKFKVPSFIYKLYVAVHLSIRSRK